MSTATYRTLVQAGCATEDQLEALGQDAVLRIKRAGSPQARAISREVEEVGDRTLRFVISDETPDRMGDIVRQSGWSFANYKRNPVVLWGHDGDTNPPIGRAASIEAGMVNGVASTRMAIEFASKEAHPFADTIFQLSKGGFLNATSVGFLPLQGGVKSDHTEEQRSEMGLGKYGVEFTKQELLENSVVSVPANPNAIQEGLSTLVGRGEIKAFDASVFEDRVAEPALEALRARFKAWESISDDWTDSIEAHAYRSVPCNYSENDLHPFTITSTTAATDTDFVTYPTLTDIQALIQALRENTEAHAKSYASVTTLRASIEQLRRTVAASPSGASRNPHGVPADLLKAIQAGTARARTHWKNQ